MKPLLPTGPAAAFAGCFLACALAPVQAGEVTRKSFDIAGGDAASTLKRFAEESGRQVVFLVDAVRGVTTKPVRGEYTVREALARLVADTGLVVAEDAKSGALMVNRAASREPRPPPAQPQPPTSPMKSSRTLLAALAGWLALGPLAEAQTATGTIEGRVFDAGQSRYLERVRLTVEGDRGQTFTDSSGRYRLFNVPAGPARVRAFYTGREPQTETVTVVAAQVTQLDITLAPPGGPTVKLDQFVVASSREMDGAAIAINEQRFASSIVNVVSADEFGTIADGSVGEFMKFLPGISTDYTGGDARKFSIGGVSPNNVPVTIGGFDLASASGSSTARAIELDQVSINNIARIEVHHSPTAESPGMALAGSVNMVPRSAFERARPVFNYSVSILMKDAERHWFRTTPGPLFRPTQKIHPGFDLSAIVPVSRNFGFTVSAGYSLQYTPQGYVLPSWRGAGATTNGTTLPDTTFDRPYLTDFALRDGAKETERYSLAATVDYRLGPNDRLSFSFQYAFLREAFANRTMNLFVNSVRPGDFAPAFVHGAPGAGEARLTTSARLRPGRTIMPTLTWRHDGPIWKAEAGLGYSNSRTTYLDIDKGFFNNSTARRTGITLSFDDIIYYRPGRITATDAAGAPVNLWDANSYAIANGTSSQNLTYDSKRTGYANLRRDFTVGRVPVSLKAGLDVRSTLRDLKGNGTQTYNFFGRDRVAATTPVGGDDAAGVVLDASFSSRVPDYGFPKVQWVSNEALWNLQAANPFYFTLDPNSSYRNYINSSKRAEETISAAFLRGDLSLLERRLKLVVGLRAEQTNIRAQGPLTDPAGNYQRDSAGRILRGANGRPLLIVPTSDALGVSKLTLLDRGTDARKEYLRLFPNLNASYHLGENLIARAAYYTSVGRPDFDQYAGAITLPDPDLLPSASNVIRVNNVGIKAWEAKSAKVRLEYYFAGVGQISIGAFRRDFKNFFGSVVFHATPEFLALYDLEPTVFGAYDVATQYNLPNGVRMEGLEFDYKQALTFLPPWARGVQVFSNASAQRATGADFFQDLMPRVYNWGVSLTRPKFNLRANWNYRGLQRRGAASGRGIEPGTYSYRSKRLYLDLSGEYHWQRHVTLFAALRNVLGATEDVKTYGPSTPKWARLTRSEDYAALWTFGVKGTF